jgi:hypothetical protein
VFSCSRIEQQQKHRGGMLRPHNNPSAQNINLQKAQHVNFGYRNRHIQSIKIRWTDEAHLNIAAKWNIGEEDCTEGSDP